MIFYEGDKVVVVANNHDGLFARYSDIGKIGIIDSVCGTNETDPRFYTVYFGGLDVYVDASRDELELVNPPQAFDLGNLFEEGK